MTLLWNEPPHWHTPLWRGREGLLDHLWTSMQQQRGTRQGPSRLALTGLSGIGKTQIALAYAAQSARHYEVRLWLDASSPETLETGVMGVLTTLDIAPSDGTWAAAFQRWLRTQPSWLLVLDHIGPFGLLHALLPHWEDGGHVLLTTTAQAVNAYATPVNVLPLDLVEATILLARRAGLVFDHLSIEKRETLANLALEVDGVPLALDQVGAALAHTDPTTLLASLRAQPARVLRPRGDVLDLSHPASFVETLEQISARLTPRERALLFLCAFLPAEALPNVLPREGLNRRLRPLGTQQLAFHDAVGTLLRQSLIQWHPHPFRRSMLPFVQRCLRSMLTASQVRAYERMARNIQEQQRGPR